MTDLRVAVAQLSASEDAAANIEAALQVIDAAAEAGAQLVLAPEYTLAWAPRLHPALGDRHAELAQALSDAARRHRVTVVAGTLEPAGERLRNVAVAFGPGGDRVAAYAKVHLFDAFGVRESEVLEPGPVGAAVTLDVEGWRVGLATCYDLRFPETFRLLADAGADVVAVGAAWADGPGKADQLDVLARARALENTSYLLLASQCGDGRTGRSAVHGPLGEEIVRADGEPQLLVADLDRERLREVRQTLPALTHRRYRIASP